MRVMVTANCVRVWNLRVKPLPPTEACEHLFGSAGFRSDSDETATSCQVWSSCTLADHERRAMTSSGQQTNVLAVLLVFCVGDMKGIASR
jgi:hypothetical protein